jgi:hypothetical protein
MKNLTSLPLLITFVAALISFQSCEKEPTNGNNLNLGGGSSGGTGSQGEIQIIYDDFKNESILLVGSRTHNFIVSFFISENERKNKSFDAVQNLLPIILKDDDGNFYDILGNVINGPDQGSSLVPTNSLMGYWFSWAAFFQDITIYGESILESPSDNYDRPHLSGDWSIPAENIIDGGVGLDGIPALTDPEFIDVSDAWYMEDDHLIIGYAFNGEIKAYPHLMLNWHEIINDNIGGLDIALTYCPLTGTGITWDRRIDGEVTTFGVSGLLYDNNLMPYDRKTGSIWSQIRMDCVNGELKGKSAKTITLVETTWKTWLDMYPDTKVVGPETGHTRPYGLYPYGNYRETGLLLFPISYEDNRLHKKERVHAIVLGEDARAYRFDSF